MTKQITLEIDGKQVSVPEGTLVVNAARKIGVDIPVFCYHPKMEPVGMCRMCLVEIGRPVVDRATGEVAREADGKPKIQFGPKLETACTTPVSEGMIVLGATDKVKAGREDILEFLLTSHPLDCPICDKGGECPLQNLTLGYGPGQSRYLYDEKMHLTKHYPLGDLIYLDRERCIQCARCVRFQEKIADDRVIGFYQRGRAWQIVTFSEPGFDSYFSGNTTDICPVGALTTADFRFRARPWEMNSAASICPHCPVGCNLTLNVRREAGHPQPPTFVNGGGKGGAWVVKRVMPRQNEAVNEIWICDKGRFGYHFSQDAERLSQPLVRKNNQLTPVSWEEALDLVSERFQPPHLQMGGEKGGAGLLTLAGGRLSNEDLYNLKQLTDRLGGKTALYTNMAGGDLTAQVGLGQGSNFGDMGTGSAILVVACDLEEEAPLWWMRVKQAAERGARLIVANPRSTKLDRAASHIIRYPYGAEAATVLALVNTLSARRPDLPDSVHTLEHSSELKSAAQQFAQAENAVILFGSEGTSLESSQALAQACANLLISTNHIGRPNNGLVGVWQRANEQGAWDMGFRPIPDLKAQMRSARALYVVAADPAGDDLSLAEAGGFLVVQDIYLTATARMADVVLPAQTFIEREGTFTSGERRVQRFYPAVPGRNFGAKHPPVPPPQNEGHEVDASPLPDFAITARIANCLGFNLEGRLASKVFAQIATDSTVNNSYKDLSYSKLSETAEQWPIIARQDLYYGGTTYENTQGLGVQLASTAQRGEIVSLGWVNPPEWSFSKYSLVAVPITRLYDRGQTLLASKLLHSRLPEPYVVINQIDADRMKISQGARLQVVMDGMSALVTARVDADLPLRIVLVPRSLGIPVSGPTTIEVKLVERATP